jgi:siroheme synthase
MPGTHYGEVAERLVENGLSPETPCVVVSQATRAEQQVRWSSIAALSIETQLPAPSILLVGRVASQAADKWSTRLTDALRSGVSSEVRFGNRKEN